MKFDTVAVSRDGAVAEIRLSRPEQCNPVDARFVQELESAASAIHDDAGVHVVMLTAGGDAFSVGGEASGDGAFRCLETMGQPVIAVIEGDAREEGLELALACDIRIASDEAVLRHGAVAAGRLPAWGATQRLPRLAGRGAAAAMILLGEPLRASDAARCGLVNMISPRAEVRAAAHRLASVMASRGPLALRYAKEAMRHGLDMPLEQALRYETDLTVILQTTHDRREGVQAFLQKRPPRFSGR